MQTGAPFAVRAARLEDAAALADLAKELGYDADAAAMAERLTRLARRDDSAVLVAVDGGGRPAGWVHVFGTEILECGRRAEIGGLVVAGASRGRGAGRSAGRRRRATPPCASGRTSCGSRRAASTSASAIA